VFAQSNNDVAVIEAKPFGQLACLLGESKVKESDYQLKPITEETDFFTEVAVGAIKQILKNKPYDQKGAEFNINLLRFRPSLTGYIVIKESYEQIDLKTAECEAAVGNVKGFSFSCVVKSPLDQQKLFLSYIYKYETKLGLFLIGSLGKVRTAAAFTTKIFTQMFK